MRTPRKDLRDALECRRAAEEGKGAERSVEKLQHPTQRDAADSRERADNKRSSSTPQEKQEHQVTTTRSRAPDHSFPG